MSDALQMTEAQKAVDEAMKRFAVAQCANIMCDEQAQQDSGVLLCGIPLCPRHANSVVPSPNQHNRRRFTAVPESELDMRGLDG